MAIFQSDAATVLKRLADKAYQHQPGARPAARALAAAEGLRARDVSWMLFRPDRSYRDAVAELLKRIGDAETVDVVIAECKGKPEAAVRAAAATLFSLGIAGDGAAPRRPRRPRARARRRRSCGGSSSTRRSRPRSSRCSGTSPRAGRVEERARLPRRAWPRPAADPKAVAPLAEAGPRPREGDAREGARCPRPATTRRGSVDLFVEQLAARRLLDPAAPRRRPDPRRRRPGRRVRRPPPAAHGLGRARPLARPSSRSCSACPTGATSSGATSSSRSRSPAGPATARSSRCAPSAPTSSSPRSSCCRDPDQEVRASAMLVATVVRGRADRAGHHRPAQGPRLVDPHHRRRDARPAQGPARRSRRSIEALADPETRWSAVEALGPHRRPARRPGPVAAAAGPRARGPHRGDPGPEPLRAPADARLRPQRGAAGPVPRRCAPAPSSSPGRWRRRSRRRSPTRTPCKQAALAAKSGAGRAEAQRAARGHAQQRAPPTSTSRSASRRCSASPPTSCAPRASRSRPSETEAMLREILTDAQWARLAEGAAARLLPLHPERRPLPRQRVRRPAGA